MSDLSRWDSTVHSRVACKLEPWATSCSAAVPNAPPSQSHADAYRRTCGVPPRIGWEQTKEHSDHEASGKPAGRSLAPAACAVICVYPVVVGPRAR